MQPHAPLSDGDKDYVWQAHQHGDSLAQIAQHLRCSVGCVRTWWRQARDHGPAALHERVRGRPPTGLGSTFPREIIERALGLKGQHPRWGGRRVWTELHTDPRLRDQSVPSPSLLNALFHTHGLTQPRRSPALTAPTPSPPIPTAGHVVWQLDAQEGVGLADNHRVTICTIRDPYGAAFIASQVVDVTTEHGYRKPTWQEVQAILRQAFSEWHTLPDVLQTDNDPAVWGGRADAFPTLLTLWLIGLGIEPRHIRPHRPTDQGAVERSHRTLADFTSDETARANAAALQHALDHERLQHNAAFPSRASDCSGRTPLQAHPELLIPRRMYTPTHEATLFKLGRVDAYLAQGRFERKVSCVGQITLGHHVYGVGQGWAGQRVRVHLDLATRQWVICNQHDEPIVRQAVCGLDSATLLGLPLDSDGSPQPVQLAFPWGLAA